MQVNKVQNNGFNTNFQAKLNITGEMFYGEVFEKMFDKASKIGTEKDVIDIKYVGYFAGASKNGKNTKFSSVFVGKFLQKGGKKSGTNVVRKDLNDSSRYAYREKAKKTAIEYIDELFEKYAGK